MHIESWDRLSSQFFPASGHQRDLLAALLSGHLDTPPREAEKPAFPIVDLREAFEQFGCSALCFQTAFPRATRSDSFGGRELCDAGSEMQSAPSLLDSRRQQNPHSLFVFLASCKFISRSDYKIKTYRRRRWENW